MLTLALAVTLSITPVGWEQTIPDVHVVQPGESLSSIDAAEGSPGPWTRLAWVNRDAFSHPDLIAVGTHLTIPTSDGKRLEYTPLRPAVTVSRSSMDAGSRFVATSSGNCGGNLPPCWVLHNESGGCADYSTCHNPTSSASGKWQVISGTWNNYGGYDTAAEAPESVQDAKAAELWDGGAGCSHWSAC